jgi:hypothetical protein
MRQYATLLRSHGRPTDRPVLATMFGPRAAARAWVRVWLLAGVVCSWACPVRGQSCHMPNLGARAADLLATYRAPNDAGEYQGYFASAAYTHPWFFAELHLPYYRLVRDGSVERGPGDVGLDLRGTLWRPAPELALGLELAGTFPSGDADRGLGMGHVMLMPGAWLGWERGSVRVLAQLAYGRMLGDAAPSHHDHSGPVPLVNPMNRSELEHAFSVSYAFAEHLFAGGRLLGAVPVAYRNGSAREIAGLALGARFAPLEVGVELQFPLLGAPFTARTALTVAAIF